MGWLRDWIIRMIQPHLDAACSDVEVRINANLDRTLESSRQAIQQLLQTEFLEKIGQLKEDSIRTEAQIRLDIQRELQRVGLSISEIQLRVGQLMSNATSWHEMADRLREVENVLLSVPNSPTPRLGNHIRR